MHSFHIDVAILTLTELSYHLSLYQRIKPQTKPLTIF